MTILKVTNKNNRLFNKNVKILQKLENEMVEVYVEETEEILCIPLEDIQKQKNKIFIPKSRKDFYQYMQEAGTSRNDIKNTVEKLIHSNGIELLDISKESLLSIFDDTEKDRLELIELFRTLRNEKKFDFNLKNRN